LAAFAPIAMSMMISGSSEATASLLIWPKPVAAGGAMESPPAISISSSMKLPSVAV
jgi:hypothetical protein